MKQLARQAAVLAAILVVTPKAFGFVKPAAGTVLPDFDIRIDGTSIPLSEGRVSNGRNASRTVRPDGGAAARAAAGVSAQAAANASSAATILCEAWPSATS